MEHNPRKPRPDAEKTVDSRQTDPRPETDEAMDRLQDSEAPGVEPAEAGDAPLDADRIFDSPLSTPISANDVEGTVDVPPLSEPQDSSARVVEGLGGDESDVTASDFVGPAFDDLPGADSIAVDSGFLPRAVPVAPPIDDLVGRPGQRGFIEQLPYFPGRDSDRRRIQLPGDTSEAATSGEVSSSASDLDSHSKALLGPTSDGGPSLARPIVLVSPVEAEQRKIVDEALARSLERDEKLADERAEAKVSYAFWLRACEERALRGDY